MRGFIFFTVAAAVGLSAVSRPARAGGTNLVYTYEGRFDLRIPAEPGATKGWMTDAVIMVPDHLIICDLDVSVTIRHSAAFDLQFLVRNPASRGVTLGQSDWVAGFFVGEDYAGTVFDDEADIGIQEGKPPFTGRYRPIGSLAVFDGQDAYGPWRLQVYDAFFRDSGYLEYFKLTFTVAAPEVVTSAPVPGAVGLAFLGLALLGPGKRALARLRR